VYCRTDAVALHVSFAQITHFISVCISILIPSVYVCCIKLVRYFSGRNHSSYEMNVVRLVAMAYLIYEAKEAKRSLKKCFSKSCKYKHGLEKFKEQLLQFTTKW